jgi:phosphomannomutase
MSIYKDCDIRGIYPSEITGSESYLIGRALATVCPGKILAGGDVRLSTPEIKGELMRGLLESGAEVTDIGTIPTPALYFALKNLLKIIPPYGLRHFLRVLLSLLFLQIALHHGKCLIVHSL